MFSLTRKIRISDAVKLCIYAGSLLPGKNGRGRGFFCTTVWGNFTCLQEI
jgi:hypothetical protein